MDVPSRSSLNSALFNQILGLPAEFGNYLVHAIEGKKLEERSIKEFGKKTVLTLTFCDSKSVALNYHDYKFSRERQIHVNNDTKTDSVLPRRKKHKTPSRIRRDKARFRDFLERKKQKKLQKKGQIISNSVLQEKQCEPTPDVTITIPSARTVTPAPDPEVPPDPTFILPTSPPGVPSSPNSDSWITDSEEETEPLEGISPEPVTNALTDSESQPDPSPTNAQPIVESPCNCLACSCPVESLEPFELADLYEECSVCFVSAEEAPNGIKPCARCLSSAYCSKKCQKQDWKEHKPMCTEEIGARVRKAREEILQRKNRALELQRTQSRCLRASAK